ncbi:MAG: ChbG/HpnK family deacetylase [Pseudomonadota bacterium]|nr:ChbG/HpnK family deacetylase [Pseudomonadota bacterium]
MTPNYKGPLRALCIALDDYGLHTGINQAALQLAAAGRVQAIGCMVGGPAWPQGSPALVELDQAHPGSRGVDLGLHLDLTECPGAVFGARPLWRLMLQCWSHKIDRSRLRAEIRRQLDAFEQAIGRPPDYVDGHQHVHQFPVVRSELVAELAQRSSQHRPWLRSTLRPAASRGAGIGVKPRLIEALGARALATTARYAGFVQNHALLGVHDFRADANVYAASLRRWLGEAADADLLMCHPSLDFDGADPILPARLAEFEVLSGADFGRWLAEAGIALQPMSRILAAPTINPLR